MSLVGLARRERAILYIHDIVYRWGRWLKKLHDVPSRNNNRVCGQVTHLHQIGTTLSSEWGSIFNIFVLIRDYNWKLTYSWTILCYNHCMYCNNIIIRHFLPWIELFCFHLHRRVVCECVCTCDIVAMYAMFDHVCNNLAMLVPRSW